jgi:hypothetical protein
VVPLTAILQLFPDQGPDYCIAVTEHGEVFSWGGGGFGPLGHPKLRPPEDDDEMEEYMMALREKVGNPRWWSNCSSVNCVHVSRHVP